MVKKMEQRERDRDEKFNLNIESSISRDKIKPQQIWAIGEN